MTVCATNILKIVVQKNGLTDFTYGELINCASDGYLCPEASFQTLMLSVSITIPYVIYGKCIDGLYPQVVIIKPFKVLSQPPIY